MIQMLILIDLIFIVVLKFPIYIIFVFFLFNKKKKFFIPFLISVFLDIIFHRIHLSLLILILSLVSIKNLKLNLKKHIILLNVYYLGIYIFLDGFELELFLKLFIINFMIFIVLKTFMKQYKFNG